nr:phage tail tape measure protein [Vibrio sp. S9_S30]
MNEASFVDVAKTLDFGEQGYRSDEAQSLRRALNELSVEMAGVSDTDVMKIAAGGANGGIAKEDLVAYTRDTVMTATAWDMTADDAAQKGMALRNSLGYADGEQGQAQFLRMSNMINDVANQNGGVSGRDLLGVMSRSGALLNNSGFKESQALALSGSLLSKGATEEQAATATKNIASALTAGFSATGSQKEVFSMLGTDAQTVALDMQDDAMATLLDVLEGIKALNKEDQSAAIKSLFGDEANPHIQKLLKDTERLTKIQLEAANASQSSVKDEYSDIASTNASNWERSKEAFYGLATVVGDRLWPAFNAVLTPITDATIATTTWVSEAGMAADVIVGLGSAVVAGAAAYKAYQGVRFAASIASHAKETLALKTKQSATDRATAAALKHANAMDRQAQALNRADRGDPKRGRTRSRRRRRGLAGLAGGMMDTVGGLVSRPALSRRTMVRGGAGLLAGGVALPALAADGLTEAAGITGTVGDTLENLSINKFAKVAGVLRPLSAGMDAVSMAANIAKGDTQAAVEDGGGLVGGLGGAAAGAAIGTMILPGIGTAIGAGIGGIVGSDVGETIASTVFDWFSDEEVPDKSKDIQTVQIKQAERAQQPNVTFAPVVQVSGSDAPEATAQLASEQIQQALAQFAAEHGLTPGLDHDINYSLEV